MNNRFLTEDYHLDLEEVLGEIKMIYSVYGLEEDENLTYDGLGVKKDILWFVDEINKMQE
jgi:hypothetical protein